MRPDRAPYDGGTATVGLGGGPWELASALEHGPLHDEDMIDCLWRASALRWVDALDAVRCATLLLRQSALLPRTLFGRHPRYKPFYAAAMT